MFITFNYDSMIMMMMNLWLVVPNVECDNKNHKNKNFKERDASNSSRLTGY